MNFKAPALELEFREGLDEPVRFTVQALDFWSRENGIPEVTVTQVLRSPKEQERIYTQHAERLIQKLNQGERMRPADRTLATELAGLSRADVMAWARRRFSWHMVGQAVDIRSRHYSERQTEQVMEFLMKRCQAPEWELLKHDVTGPHIHIGRKDWKKRTDTQ